MKVAKGEPLTIRQYKNRAGLACPCCRADLNSYGEYSAPTIEADNVFQHVVCGRCSSEFDNIYEFNGYDNLIVA